jgi:hypothetical protein
VLPVVSNRASQPATNQNDLQQPPTQNGRIE